MPFFRFSLGLITLKSLRTVIVIERTAWAKVKVKENDNLKPAVSIFFLTIQWEGGKPFFRIVRGEIFSMYYGEDMKALTENSKYPFYC